ncbi:MAG: NfeD family protein [Candidatus Bipolaricaulia bacterium]
MTLWKLITHWYVWPWFPLVGLPVFWLLPWEIALPIYIVGSGWSIIEFVAWWRSELYPVRSGPEALVGRSARVVKVEAGGAGWVRVGGELWRARFRSPSHPGQNVRVADVKRTMLIVE